VTDVNSNVSTCTATVTVEDNIAPNAVCQNITVQLDGNGNASITAADVDGGSTDNCAIASITATPTAFNCSNVGPNSVTLTVTDVNSNVSTCTATVTVEDNIAPNAVCQNITVQLDANGNASITAADVDGGSTDNCAIASITATPTAFNCSNVGPNSVTLTVTDVNSNVSTCTAIVSVFDTIPPNALCQDVTVYLDQNGIAFVTANDLDAGSTDNCGIATITTNVFAYGCGNVNTTNIGTLTVTDVNGNVSTCTSNITVLDTIPPTIVCQNITIALDSNGQYEITNPYDLIASVTDNCGAVVCNIDTTVTQSRFTCDDIGVVTVTVIGSDVNGNTSTCTALVTVTDTIAPVAVCQDITVQLDANGQASITVSDVDGGSYDNCEVILTANPTSFTCADVGVNAVVLTAADSSGNSDQCTANVTVEDTIAPNAVCQNITVQLDGNGNASITAADVDAGSTDNCGILSIDANPTSFTCANVGNNAVTLTVTDVNNNVSTCTANVTVLDTVPPVAVCQNITVQLDANGNATIAAADINGGSTDNCGILSITANPTAFSCADVGPNTVTLTVTDVNNNVSTCTAIVTVEDNIAPNALCQNITLNIGSSGSVTITPADVDGGSTDNCGIASLSIDNDTFDCSDLGANLVILTVTDINGNVSTCTATVTVTNDPLIVSLASPTFACGYNISCNGASDGSIVSTTTGGCLPYSYNWSNNATTANLANLPAGSYTVTVTDINGTTATANITLTEPDPVVITLTSPTYNGGWNISCNGENDGSITSVTTGGCPAYIYNWSNGSTAANPGTLVAGTYSVTATDANGCTATSSITLTEPPVLTADAGPDVRVFFGYMTANCTTLNGSQTGGTPAYSVTWSDGNSIISNTSSVQVCPTTTTVYYYTVVDANGCTTTDSVVVCVLDVRCTDRTNNGQTGNGQGGNGQNQGQGQGGGLVHVSICHIPPGNPANAMTKCIPAPAVASHLSHGDYLGACGTDTLACELVTDTCALVLNFDKDANGNNLPAGTKINNQWAAAGIVISANNDRNNGPDQAILFNSAAPTGGDPDLGTPNQAYGGPGIGNGGSTNTVPEGMLLIIAENITDNNNDGLVDNPDDEAQGGTISFQFTNTAVRVDTMVFIDIDDNQATTITVEKSDNSTVTFVLPDAGDNGRVTAFINESDVVALHVNFSGSGGIAGLYYCDDGEVIVPSPCLAVLDFDTDGNGNPLLQGTPITNQWANYGLTITTDNARNNGPDQGIIFNSAIPTGGDTDLGTPNQIYSGPGIGSGGVTNYKAEGNILIIAENVNDNNNDGRVDNPDDEAQGGTITFNFDPTATVDSIVLIDVDDNTGWSAASCRLFSGQTVSFPIPNMGDNSRITIPLMLDSVVKLTITLGGSGSVAALYFCTDGPPATNAKVAEEVVDNGGMGQSAGNSLEAQSFFTAFPNPFENQTTLRFELASDEDVQVQVYDMRGKLIATLYDDKVKSGQMVETTFKPDDVTDGLYMAKLITKSGMVMTKKLAVRR
jgi:hypothetical protein